MTLVISCATQEYILQVSDRRLTNAHTGGVVEDQSNKAVLFSGRVVFGYTGLAELEGERTDEWLARVLLPGCETMRETLEVVKAKATEAVRSASGRLTQSQKRVAIVGLGWFRLREGEELRAVFNVVSNCMDREANWLDEANEEFEVHAWPLRAHDLHSVHIAGQNLLPQESASTRRSIRRCLAHRAGPRALGRVLRQSPQMGGCLQLPWLLTLGTFRFSTFLKPPPRMGSGMGQTLSAAVVS